MTKPILLIRANGNQGDSAALAELGLSSVSEPYLQISPISGPGPAKRLLESLDKADWLVATSVNSIKFWSDLVGNLALTTAFWNGIRRGMRFAAIGEATAEALRNLGAQEVLVSATSNAEALVQEILDSQGAPGRTAEFLKPVAVIPSGNLNLDSLVQRFLDQNWSVYTEVLFTVEPVKTRPQTLEQVLTGEFAAVLLRSTSAAKTFAEFAGESEIFCVCAGSTTARKARELGLNVVAVSPDASHQQVAKTVLEAVTLGQTE